ncbi:MAG: hypothetical protein HC802_19660, partial [Caldilineaceae bacterium]|nr:hypothetical protein [Caldilineaceae bacterium]
PTIAAHPDRFIPKSPRIETSQAEFEKLLDNAVASRLEADVPLGCFLSGGVDSSLLAALAIKHKPDLQTFTVRMPDPRYDESEHAEFVADQLGTKHTTLDVAMAVTFTGAVVLNAAPVDQNDAGNVALIAQAAATFTNDITQTSAAGTNAITVATNANFNAGVNQTHLVNGTGGMVGAAFWWLGVGVERVDQAASPNPLLKLKACSHMLGVLPEWQGQRVGLRLKLAQREAVLRQGLTDWVTWTYDPLYRPNGVFNIHRLGATCNTYARNVYGELQDDLNRGVPSDRCQVDWRLNSPHVLHDIDARRHDPRVGDRLHASAAALHPGRWSGSARIGATSLGWQSAGRPHSRGHRCDSAS